MGIPIAANVTFASNQRNFTTQVNQILASGANIVILSMQSADAAYFYEACASAGIKAPNYIFLVSDTMLTPTITTVNGQVSVAAGLGLQSSLLATITEPTGPQYSAMNATVYSVCVGLPTGCFCCTNLCGRF